MQSDKLRSLAELAEILESQGNIVEANRVHSMFVKEAAEFKKKYNVPFPMNLDEALNNYDSENYQIDSDGSWDKIVFYSMLHVGDSDTTGTICGFLYGLYYGLDAVYNTMLINMIDHKEEAYNLSKKIKDSLAKYIDIFQQKV